MIFLEVGTGARQELGKVWDEGERGKNRMEKTLGDGDGDEGRKILEPAVLWANGLSLEQKDGFYGFGWWGAEGTLKFLPLPPWFFISHPCPCPRAAGIRGRGSQPFLRAPLCSPPSSHFSLPFSRS